MLKCRKCPTPKFVIRAENQSCPRGDSGLVFLVLFFGIFSFSIVFSSPQHRTVILENSMLEKYKLCLSNIYFSTRHWTFHTVQQKPQVPLNGMEGPMWDLITCKKYSVTVIFHYIFYIKSQFFKKKYCSTASVVAIAILFSYHCMLLFIFRY